MLYNDSFDSKVIAFLNGYVRINCDLKRVEFTTWEKDPHPTFKTRHYIEQQMTGFSDDGLVFTPGETPLWDEILNRQLLTKNQDGSSDDSQIGWFEGFVGRLQFEVREMDNWQKTMAVIGVTNTGKSSVLKVIARMFPADLVFGLNGSFERTFGYAALASAKVIISPETPRNLPDFLPGAIFQSMVTGDLVPIPVKFGQPKSIYWKTPGIWAGNDPFQYKDSKGQIARRVVYVVFDKVVTVRDTSMEDNIIADELPTILIRCVSKYFDLLSLVGDADVDNFLPPALKNAQDELSSFTNPLESFIQNGSDFYKILKKKGASTKMTDLDKAYANFMEFGPFKQKGQYIGRDYYPLIKNGFTVVSTRVCKMCDQKVSRKNCGDHYDPTNRKRLVVIEGMQLERAKDTQRLPEIAFSAHGNFGPPPANDSPSWA